MDSDRYYRISRWNRRHRWTDEDMDIFRPNDEYSIVPDQQYEYRNSNLYMKDIGGYYMPPYSTGQRGGYYKPSYPRGNNRSHRGYQKSQCNYSDRNQVEPNYYHQPNKNREIYLRNIPCETNAVPMKTEPNKEDDNHIDLQEEKFCTESTTAAAISKNCDDINDFIVLSDSEDWPAVENIMRENDEKPEQVVCTPKKGSSERTDGNGTPTKIREKVSMLSTYVKSVEKIMKANAESKERTEGTLPKTPTVARNDLPNMTAPICTDDYTTSFIKRRRKSVVNITQTESLETSIGAELPSTLNQGESNKDENENKDNCNSKSRKRRRKSIAAIPDQIESSEKNVEFKDREIIGGNIGRKRRKTIAESDDLQGELSKHHSICDENFDVRPKRIRRKSAHLSCSLSCCQPQQRVDKSQKGKDANGANKSVEILAGNKAVENLVPNDPEKQLVTNVGDRKPSKIVNRRKSVNTDQQTKEEKSVAPENKIINVNSTAITKNVEANHNKLKKVKQAEEGKANVCRESASHPESNTLHATLPLQEVVRKTILAIKADQSKMGKAKKSDNKKSRAFASDCQESLEVEKRKYKTKKARKSTNKEQTATANSGGHDGLTSPHTENKSSHSYEHRKHGKTDRDQNKAKTTSKSENKTSEGILSLQDNILQPLQNISSNVPREKLKNEIKKPAVPVNTCEPETVTSQRSRSNSVKLHEYRATPAKEIERNKTNKDTSNENKKIMTNKSANTTKYCMEKTSWSKNIKVLSPTSSSDFGKNISQCPRNESVSSLEHRLTVGTEDKNKGKNIKQSERKITQRPDEKANSELNKTPEKRGRGRPRGQKQVKNNTANISHLESSSATSQSSKRKTSTDVDNNIGNNSKTLGAVDKNNLSCTPQKSLAGYKIPKNSNGKMTTEDIRSLDQTLGTLKTYLPQETETTTTEDLEVANILDSSGSVTPAKSKPTVTRPNSVALRDMLILTDFRVTRSKSCISIFRLCPGLNVNSADETFESVLPTCSKVRKRTKSADGRKSVCPGKLENNNKRCADSRMSIGSTKKRSESKRPVTRNNSTNESNPPTQNNSTNESNPPTQNNSTNESNPPTQNNTLNDCGVWSQAEGTYRKPHLIDIPETPIIYRELNPTDPRRNYKTMVMFKDIVRDRELSNKVSSSKESNSKESSSKELSCKEPSCKEQSTKTLSSEERSSKESSSKESSSKESSSKQSRSKQSSSKQLSNKQSSSKKSSSKELSGKESSGTNLGTHYSSISNASGGIERCKQIPNSCSPLERESLRTNYMRISDSRRPCYADDSDSDFAPARIKRRRKTVEDPDYKPCNKPTSTPWTDTLYDITRRGTKRVDKPSQPLTMEDIFPSSSTARNNSLTLKITNGSNDKEITYRQATEESVVFEHAEPLTCKSVEKCTATYSLVQEELSIASCAKPTIFREFVQVIAETLMEKVVDEFFLYVSLYCKITTYMRDLSALIFDKNKDTHLNTLTDYTATYLDHLMTKFRDICKSISNTNIDVPTLLERVFKKADKFNVGCSMTDLYTSLKTLTDDFESNFVCWKIKKHLAEWETKLNDVIVIEDACVQDEVCARGSSQITDAPAETSSRPGSNLSTIFRAETPTLGDNGTFLPNCEPNNRPNSEISEVVARQFESTPQEQNCVSSSAQQDKEIPVQSQSDDRVKGGILSSYLDNIDIRLLQTMSMSSLDNQTPQHSDSQPQKKSCLPTNHQNPDFQPQKVQSGDTQPQKVQSGDSQLQDVQSQNIQRQNSQPQNLQPQSMEPQNLQQQSLQPQNLQPPNLQPQNLQPQNLQPANLQPENLQPQNLQPRSLQPQNLQPQNLQPQNLQAQNLQPPNLQRENLQPQNLQPQSLQPQSLQPQNIQPQNLQPQNLQPPNLQPENLHPQNLQPQSLQPQNLPPPNLQPQNIRPQNLQAQNLQPQNLQPQNLQPQSLQPQSLQPQSLQPQSLQPQNVQPQNLQPPNLQPENLHPQNLQPQSLQPENLPPPNLQPQNIWPQNLQAQNLQPQNLQPQNLQPQNVQPQNIPPQNLQPQDIQLQNIQPQNLQSQTKQPQNLQPQNLQPQNLQSQNLQPQNIPPQNLQLQDIQPQNIQPQNLQPQNIQPQNLQPQNIQPQYLQPQKLQPQNLETQNLLLQNIPLQNLLPQNLQTQNSQTQKLPQQNLQTQKLQTQNLQTQKLHTQKLQTQKWQAQKLQTPKLQTQKLQQQNIHLPNLQPQNLLPQNLLPQNLQSQKFQPQDLLPQSLQSLNLQPLNLQPLNLQPLNLQPQNLQTLNLQPHNLQPLNLQAQNLQPLNLQTQNLQTQKSQTQNFQSQNFQPQNLQSQNLWSQNFHPQNIQAQNFQHRNFQPHNFQPQNVPCQSLPPQNLCHQGLYTPKVQQQQWDFQGLLNQMWDQQFPQGLQYQNWQPQNVQQPSSSLPQQPRRKYTPKVQTRNVQATNSLLKKAQSQTLHHQNLQAQTVQQPMLSLSVQPQTTGPLSLHPHSLSSQNVQLQNLPPQYSRSQCSQSVQPVQQQVQHQIKPQISVRSDLFSCNEGQRTTTSNCGEGVNVETHMPPARVHRRSCDNLTSRTSSTDSGWASPLENLDETEEPRCFCNNTAQFQCTCNKAHYCSTSCQNSDWLTHRSHHN